MKLNLTINQIHKGLLEKEFSAQEITNAYLRNIKEKDKEINSFLAVSEDRALSQAKAVDEMIDRGQEIPMLAGVPCAIKDVVLVEGLACTAGSRILENYVAPYDATVINKLKKEGAVILGKTNPDEFAMGSSTENSAFGPTKNPHDLSRVPGGSSGGSAAAVAGDMCVFALGSDTGGSIRQPASFCGIVGLKPTYGAVSRYGLIAFASSLDQIGPMTKTIDDCEIVFDAISGKDEMDSTSVETPKIENCLPAGKAGKLEIENLRIGVPKEYFVKGIDPDIEKIINEAIKKYEAIGVKIIQISLPHTPYALPAYYIIAPSEASSNLARFDGIKYGYNSKKTKNLIDTYLRTRGEGFGKETQRRIMLGTYALSAGYYDAYYLKAQKVRTLIKKDFEDAFQTVDAIFTPTCPTPAFRLGEKDNDPLSMYLSDIFTVSINLASLPAISIPAGETNDGLPVGLQIVGKPFDEEKIMKIGKLLS